MEILGAIGGLIGAFAAVVTIYHSRSVRSTAREIEVEKLLDEAWDLMGGRKGATEIVARPASPAEVEEARRRIRDARRLDGKSSRAARYQGVHHLLQGRLDVARTCFEEAVKLSKSMRDLAAAQCNLGNRQAEEGQLREAIVSYRKAIQADPDHYLLHYNLGLAHHQLGELDEALASYEAAQKKNSFFPQTYVYRAKVRIDRDELTEAMPPLQKALSLDPSYHRAYFEMGRLEEKQGDVEAAVGHYEKALALKPEDPQAAEALERIRLANQARGVGR